MSRTVLFPNCPTVTIFCWRKNQHTDNRRQENKTGGRLQSIELYFFTSADTRSCHSMSEADYAQGRCYKLSVENAGNSKTNLLGTTFLKYQNTEESVLGETKPENRAVSISLHPSLTQWKHLDELFQLGAKSNRSCAPKCRKSNEYNRISMDWYNYISP